MDDDVMDPDIARHILYTMLGCAIFWGMVVAGFILYYR